MDQAVTPSNASTNEDSAISPHTTPRRPVSSSDRINKIPQLSPSPKFREPAQPRAREEAVNARTPSRTTTAKLTGSALFLQMPQRDQPSSPKPDQATQAEPRESYESPGSVLPRHSRGLDFSRARTNLHHSTIPDQSTPGSSPVVSKGGIDIPQRRGSIFSGVNDSPRGSFNSAWYNGQDRFFRPRSMGSVTALTSDTSTTSSDEDDNASRMDEEEMLSTPQANREVNTNAGTPYGTREETITGGMVHNPSPMQRRFHPFRRTKPPLRGGARVTRYRKPESRKSPEDSACMDEGGEDVDMLGMTRRDSISTVTDKLRISRNPSGNDSGDEGPFQFQSGSGVVRRPVTRRSNLLPKTKGFARIKAALQEETAPVDSESKREAEVIRQVRVSDLGTSQRGGKLNASISSPDLTPTVSNMPMDASDMSDLDGQGVSQPHKNSTGTESEWRSSQRGMASFWPPGQDIRATPPPQLTQPPFFFQRPRSSSGVSGVSEDMRLDSPTTANTPASGDPSSTPHRAPSDPEAPHFQLPNLPSAAEISKKVSKRRRDDDWDPASIKRRAVSPGLSVHSSPILGQSPVSNSGGWWGPIAQGQAGGAPARPHRENSSGSAANAPDDRSASLGSNGINPATPSIGPKRVGMQGMTDTNDGFTRMTIE